MISRLACLVLVATPVIAANCAGTPAAEPVRSLLVRTAWPGGDTGAVPAQQIGTRVGVLPGLDHTVLELGPPPDPTADWYRELRGSPVYSGTALVGVVHELYGTRSTRLAGMLDARCVEQGWSRASAGASETAGWERSEGGDEALSPGDAVWMLSVWGDVNVGAQGTVTEVRDGRVWFLAADEGPTAPPRDGPSIQALARARFRAVATRPLLGAARFSDVGSAVGSVVWHAALESVAELGVLPPSTDVECVIDVGSGSSASLRFRIVHEAPQAAVRTALFHALTPARLRTGPEPVQVQLDADGLPPSRTAVDAARATPIYGIVRYVLDQVFKPGAPWPARIHLRISQPAAE